MKIPETQVKDVAIGQVASIDTRNGIIPGHVSRIDPAAVNGTVDVDVKLEGALPPGARPDLSVDGTIKLETLDRRGLRGPAGDRPAGRQDHAVQAGPGRQRSAARAR